MILLPQEFGAESSHQVSFGSAPQVDFEPVSLEIGQDKLKTQLVSCISDLEKDR